MNIKLLFSSLIILLFSFSLKSQVSLVFPKNNYVFDSTTVEFIWNDYSNANSYQIQVATDPNFSTLVINESNLSTTNFTVNNLTANKTYYWKVKADNSTYSSFYSFKVVDFTSWPELEFMLNPDSVELDGDGNVEQWTDLSGNDHHYEQTSSAKRPSLTTDTQVNNQKVLVFNPNLPNYLEGDNLSHLNEGEIFSLVKKRVFPVTSSLGSSIWRFGGSSALDVYPNPNDFVSSGFGRSVRFSEIYTSDSLEMCTSHILNISSGGSFNFNVNNQLRYTNTTGNVSFPTQTILGRGRPGLNFYFDGFFGQTLLFNTVLSDSLRNLVHAQMQHKYAPPVNLGRDIAYSLCDSVLYAGEHFNSYLWSNGSTADSLIVDTSGTYWVEVVDIFGNVSRDSIKVLTKQFEYPNQTEFCYGDSIIWQTNLDSNYIYLWSDNSTGDSLIIDATNDIHVAVTDAYGCTFQSDTLSFSRDDFEITASLGPDTSMCSGNKLGLTTGANNAVSYLWSTGETSPKITINTSGIYSVIAESSLGCQAKDTINVNIQGDAPIVNAQLPNIVCVGETFTFQDQSTTTDASTVVEWEWSFGNGDSAWVATGDHAYDTSGFYAIDLTVGTSAGCYNEMTDTIEVKANPEMTFSTANHCQEENIQFNGGQLSPQTITDWSWNFDDPSSGIDSVATGQDPSHTYVAPGDYEVMLIGTDVFGCIDTLVQTITIDPVPEVDFTFDEVCEGNVVTYQNTSTVANPSSISSYQWDFGDGTTSNQINPQKPYTAQGVYTVELTATTNNNCSSSATQDIKIHATPQVDFNMMQACAGIATQFMDNSYIPNGSVAQVDWSIDGQPELSGFTVSKLFENSGNYELEQTVQSSFGCMNTSTSTINIKDFIQADFTFSPSAFVTDYPILFESTSEGAEEYYWTFGNFATAIQSDTSIVFEENQIGTQQEVQLVVKNQWNCRDTVSVELPVLEQRTDLELSQLFSQDNNGYLNIGVRLKNTGTTPINEVDLILGTPSTGFIKETWTGTLQANEEEIHVFSGSPNSNFAAEDTLQNYLCIEGRIVEPNQFKEEDFSNNEVCKTMSIDQTVVIAPYPNPVKNQLTIKVLMPEEGVVGLEVYDNLGKSVYTIAEKQELEKGLNVFTLDTDGWPSGTYKIHVSTSVGEEGRILTRSFVKVQ